MAWAYPPSVLTSSTNARNFPEGNRPEVEYTVPIRFRTHQDSHTSAQIGRAAAMSGPLGRRTSRDSHLRRASSRFS